jgi:hypothetical protein
VDGCLNSSRGVIFPGSHRTQLRHIARLFAAPFSTLARVLNCLGLGRLRNLEAKPKVQCYEREMAGEPTHNAV